MTTLFRKTREQGVIGATMPADWRYHQYYRRPVEHADAATPKPGQPWRFGGLVAELVVIGALLWYFL